MSVLVVLVTTTLSVLPLLPPPRVSATISNISTAAPTINTHGSVYQVVDSVLDVALVVVVAETVVSCAQAIAFVRVNTSSIKLYW